MDQIGMDRIGMDQIRMEWIRLEWNGSGWNGSEWNGSDWIGSDWNGSDWIGMDQIGVFRREQATKQIVVDRFCTDTRRQCPVLLKSVPFAMPLWRITAIDIRPL